MPQIELQDPITIRALRFVKDLDTLDDLMSKIAIPIETDLIKLKIMAMRYGVDGDINWENYKIRLGEVNKKVQFDYNKFTSKVLGKEIEQEPGRMVKKTDTKISEEPEWE